MPEPELTKPIAAFTADVQSGESPLTVAFANTSTGTIVGYAWSFGDGSVSSDKDPSHTFDTPGNYTVSLTVFNEAGNDQAEYRIDVTAAEEYEAPDLAETIGDLIPSIRAMLRRPSEQKLRYKDILDVLNDLLRGYARDLNLSELDHRTDERQCVLNHLDGSDYLLTVAGVSEVEPLQLRFIRDDQRQQNSGTEVWSEVDIVPLNLYSDRSVRDYSLCSFYGGLVLDSGVKVKLNLAKETVERSTFVIRFRMPIIRLLTLAARTPLPADFLPMLKLEAAVLCLPRMRDDTTEFYAWRKANEPIFVQSIKDWRDRWDDFVNSNMEPQNVKKIAANDYRRIGGRPPKYTVQRDRIE